jgi:glycosyltransferase involved in cell wall biosynthesis
MGIGKKVLLVSAVASHPCNCGAAVRPVYLAKQLRLLGYAPHFAFTDFGGGNLREMTNFWGKDKFHYFPYRSGNPQMELKRIVRSLGLANTRLSHLWRSMNNKPTDPNRRRPTVDDYYDDSMTPWLSELHSCHGFNAVIAHYVIMSKALEAFPRNVPKILDTLEVFAVGREAAAAKGERLWTDITPNEEVKGLQRADFVWTVQQHDERTLRPYLGNRVLNVGLFIDPISELTESSLKSKNILFVGGNHPANVEGLRWFGAEVFPHLKSWLPPENVVVVGNVKNAVGGELPFRFLGPVRDLGPVYEDARIAICPMLSGTGLKSKNVEAFAFSKPVVTTSFGRLGMEDADGRAHLVADQPETFAEAIQKLMTDDELCRRMMHEDLAYAGEWNERFREPMQRCLETGRQPS